MEFSKIELKDKDLFNRFLRDDRYRNSESTFTNLYIWRKSYNVRWALIHNMLVIHPAFENESWFLPPYGEDQYFAETIEEMIKQAQLEGTPFVLKAVSAWQKTLLEQYFPDQFLFNEDRDLADYLYDAEKLRTLSGRKYHAKRNHLNYFLSNMNYQYEEIQKKDFGEIKEFLEQWCRQKACSNGENKLDDMLSCERKAIFEALDAFDQLDYKGAVIRIDGLIKAFTFGEMMNQEEAVIHVEKADHTIRGLYPAINQLFLSNTLTAATIVNREEDTGDAGLRKAKESYCPMELLTKYQGVLK